MLMIEASKSAFYRGSAVAACLAAAGLVSGTSASAQLSQPWTWCVNKEKAAPDVQIKGCTSVIGSGKETPKNLSIAYNNRGNGYRTKGENDRAIADYSQSMRLDPKYASPHNGRANSYRDKGDNDRAIAEYNEAIRLDPRYSLAYNGRGNAYLDKKEVRPGHCRLQPIDHAGSQLRFAAQRPRQRLSLQGRRRHRPGRLHRGDPARSQERAAVQRPRQRVFRQEGLRPGHRRIQRGDPARCQICHRLQQSRARLQQKARL